MPDSFRTYSGESADQPLDEEIVARKFDALAEQIAQATGRARTREEVAAGFLSIAIENMANAIKKISVQRGYDVTEYTLCSFGGAGGQHACLVADALGIKRVFIHKHAGVLSAFGMGLADLRVMRDKAVEDTLGEKLVPRLETVYAELEQGGIEQMQAQIVPGQEIRVERKLRLRYAGSDTALLVGYGTCVRIIAAFEQVHRQHYGFVADKAIIVEAVQVEVIGVQPRRVNESPPASQTGSVEPFAKVRAIMAGEQQAVDVYRRDELPPGEHVAGPAIVIEDNSTIVIEPGWQATYTQHRDLVLERTVALPQRVAIGTQVDPVMLEIFQQPVHEYRRADGHGAGKNRRFGKHQGAVGFFLRHLRPRR